MSGKGAKPKVKAKGKPKSNKAGKYLPPKRRFATQQLGKRVPPHVFIKERLRNNSSVFQVQGQYLYIKTVVYNDYNNNGQGGVGVQQLYIDPQDTFEILRPVSSTVIGAEPVHITCHALQPNVLTSFGPPDPSQPIANSSSKVLLALTGIPLQYPTGVGGSGFREFGWNKQSVQINPSNEPAWVQIYNFHVSQLPAGAVWDMTDTESNMCLGAVRFCDVDTFDQAECNIQLRWSFTVRVPLPNLNTAAWTVRNAGPTGLDRVGTGENIPYAPALTEISAMKRDPTGPSVEQAMYMSEQTIAQYEQSTSWDEQELIRDFAKLNMDKDFGEPYWTSRDCSAIKHRHVKTPSRPQ